MHKEQEIEIKTLISQTLYDRLKKEYFADIFPHTQTNTYYDTPTHGLKQKNSALRIRQKENRQTLTLKVKQDTYTTHEFSLPLADSLLTTIEQSETFIAHLPKDWKSLRPIASFTTKRMQTTLSFGTLFLDHTQFTTHHCDYELEIEVFDHAQIKIARQWIQQYQSDITQALPKIARALAQLSI